MERNLLSNSVETIKALGVIEGESWLREQMGKDDIYPNRVVNALSWLDRSRKHGLFVINGNTGWRRWYVYPDGSVRCSIGRADPDPDNSNPATSVEFKEALDRITKLGFEIIHDEQGHKRL